MKNANEKLSKRIMHIMNRFSLKRKFFFLYVICVILPIVATDIILIMSVYQREKSAFLYDMEYVTSIYKNELFNKIQTDRTMANAVNINGKINEFLNYEYESPYEYYDTYYSIINGSFMRTIAGISNDNIVIYADNETILSGVSIKKLSEITNKDWYKEFVENGEEDRLVAFYDDNPGLIGGKKRKFYYIKKLTYLKNACSRIVVIDNDYDTFLHEMRGIDNKYPMYISCGDYILYTNMDSSAIHVSDLDIGKLKPFTTTVKAQGCEMDIVLLSDTKMVHDIILSNIPTLLSILVFTIVIPFIAMILLQKSIVHRIHKMEKAFGESTDTTFHPIDNIDGTDEIAGLMYKYNDMVEITNNLIKTVYKDKLKEQETDLARKNAELLALQSQINPHFLFNALESIRMHSLLKGEDETSMMVGKLALMQRQNVEWGSDLVTIKKEMESIEAYLYLQKYRFGDRLSFEIEMDDDCENYLVPKLTLVTFVENACVHGVESKPTPGWIFVRTYTKDDNLVIEVEDTGGGMDDDEVASMLSEIENVSIDVIKERKHVGVLNACLRLKMISNNEVKFDIYSEEGVGMCVEIRIPIDSLNTLGSVRE